MRHMFIPIFPIISTVIHINWQHLYCPMHCPKGNVFDMILIWCNLSTIKSNSWRSLLCLVHDNPIFRVNNAQTEDSFLHIHGGFGKISGVGLWWTLHDAGMVLCTRPANERRRYTITSSPIGPFWRDPWGWRPDLETLSILQAVCVGNPPVTDGFHSERGSDARLWYHLWNYSKLPMVWDAY